MVTKAKDKPNTTDIIEKERSTRIHVDKLIANPWQADNREADQDLVDSIKNYGMIEIPMGRPMGEGFIQLASGHRRLDAHRKLVALGLFEFNHMRVRVREIEDRQMADIVLQENKRRQDLDPIAEARVYKKYISDFKVTQTALAEIMGISQGEVANKLRLLDLPDGIQEKVISHEILPTHARTLLRVNEYPVMQKAAVEFMEKKQPNVTQLEDKVEEILVHNSKSLELDQYRSDAPHFDISKCEKCKQRVMLKVHSWNDVRYPRCLDGTCWQKKEEESLESQARQLKEEASRMKKEGKGKVLSKKPQWGTFESLYPYVLDQLDNPEECRSCDHGKVMAPDYDNKLELICVDLKCFKDKKRRHTIEVNKLKKQKDEDVRESLDRLVAGLKDPTSKECYLMLLEHLLNSASTDIIRWFMKQHNIKLKSTWVLRDKLYKFFADASDDDLRRATVRLCLEMFRPLDENNSYSPNFGRFNHHVNALSNKPVFIDIADLEGDKRTFDIRDIRLLVKENGSWRLQYAVDGGQGSMAVTDESAERLIELGVNSKEITKLE